MAARRAANRSTEELLSWCESMAANMGYLIHDVMNNGNINSIYEAIEHNDALHALLLEIQLRQVAK